MTTTPLSPAASGGTYLSTLLRHPLSDRGGQPLGRLADVIIQLHGTQYPPVTGLVARVGRRQVFIPAAQVSSLAGDTLTLTSAGSTCAGSSAATARCCCAPTYSGTGSSTSARPG